MNEHEQDVLDGIEAATVASTLDRSTLVLIDALSALTRLGATRLHTATIVEALEEEAAWSHWATIPIPAAARELAELLENHGVRPRSVTVAGRRARGYVRDDLEQAWHAYAGQAFLLPDDFNDNNGRAS